MDLDNSSYSAHISQTFNEDLQTLKNEILKMGGLVERQVINAVEALTEGDTLLAEKVREMEFGVNDYEIKLDEECTRILALRQPAASDLRMVIAVSKAITDLERIGDESDKIAKLAIALVDEGGAPKGLVQTRHIGNLVRVMVQQALDAFARLDVHEALKVVQQDKSVDQEYESAMRQLVTYMMEDPRSISRVLKVVWALRSLERIGDHARNIGEQLIYIVQGKDVRHRKLDQVKAQVLSQKLSE